MIQGGCSRASCPVQYSAMVVVGLLKGSMDGCDFISLGLALKGSECVVENKTVKCIWRRYVALIVSQILVLFFVLHAAAYGDRQIGGLRSIWVDDRIGIAACCCH